MRIGWKASVAGLVVLVAGGLFVQQGLGAPSPRPSIDPDAAVGVNDPTFNPPNAKPIADADRQRGSGDGPVAGRPDRADDDGRRDRGDDGRRDRADKDRGNDAQDGRKDRGDDRNRGDEADDGPGVRPVNPRPQPVPDNEGDSDDGAGDGGDDSDDGGGDD